jgi:hypothetical protein
VRLDAADGFASIVGRHEAFVRTASVPGPWFIIRLVPSQIRTSVTVTSKALKNDAGRILRLLQALSGNDPDPMVRQKATEAAEAIERLLQGAR